MRERQREAAEKQKKNKRFAAAVFLLPISCDGTVYLARPLRGLCVRALICGTEDKNRTTTRWGKWMWNAFSITYMYKHDLWRSIGSDQSNEVGLYEPILSSSAVAASARDGNISLNRFWWNPTVLPHYIVNVGWPEPANVHIVTSTAFRISEFTATSGLSSLNHILFLVIQLVFNLISLRISFLFYYFVDEKERMRATRLEHSNGIHLRTSIPLRQQQFMGNVLICTWQTCKRNQYRAQLICTAVLVRSGVLFSTSGKR